MDGQELREALAKSVGGRERLASFYSARTFGDLNRRADMEIEGAAETIERAVALTAKRIADEKLEEFHSGSDALVKVLIRAWAMYQHAGSQVLNWMITGPARFPVARNEKRMNTEHKRWQEFDQIAKRAPERAVKIARRIQRARIGAGGLADAELADLRKRLEARELRQRGMKATNEAIRRNKLGRDVESAERLVAVMEERGFPLSKALAIQLLTPDYGSPGYASFSLSNNNAEIHRLRGRIAQVERKVARIETAEASDQEPAEQEINGARIVEDAADDRLRIFFPDKPAPTVISALKSRGFRWSPSAGAWQRQLTNNARWAAESILKAA